MPGRRILFSLMVLLFAAPARADELTTLAGQKLAGRFVDLEAGEVVFLEAGAAEPVRLPTKALQQIDFRAPPPLLNESIKRDEVELTDGSLLPAARFALKGKFVELAALAGPGGVEPPALTLPLGAVLSVCRGAEDADQRGEWQKLVAGRGKRDLFVVRQSEGLNPLPGTVLEGAPAGDAVRFEREDGRVLNLKLSRLNGGGIVFNQPPVVEGQAQTLCKVRDVFGNLLFAQSLTVTRTAGDPDAPPGLEVVTVAGARAVYPSFKAIGKLDFSEGNVAYLADLTPRALPSEGAAGELALTYLVDRFLDGSPLRLDGATQSRSVWIDAAATLDYSLPGEFRQFQALVGVDESVQEASKGVLLTIEGDGRVLYRGAVRRGDKPKSLTLDVKGVKELRIRTEGEGLLPCGPTLANARVLK